MDITTRKLKSTISNRGRYEIKLLTYGIILVFFFLYLISLNSTSTESNKQLSIFLLSWSGISTFVYIMYTWFKITGQLFTPYIIFMLFFFLFNYGQPFMWAFGIHMPNEIGVAPIYPGHGVATDLDIVKTQIYVLMCAWMLHFGALLAVRNKKREISNGQPSPLLEEVIDYKTLNLIFKVSLLFAAFSVPITLWANFEDLRVAMTYGYRALYFSEHARRGASLVTFFSYWFFPSLLGLLIGSKFGKKTSTIVFFIMVIFILLNVAAGNRHPWIYKVVILFWIKHIVHKPIKKRAAIKYALIAVVSVYFLDVVVSLRNIGINIEAIIDSLSLSNSSVTKVIFEMGASMNPTLYIQKYGAEFWQYGNTYLLALGGLITNRFLDLFGIPYGIISRHFGAYLGISWGPGFSIVAEPLMNFGPIFAPLFMIVKGFLLSLIFYVDKDIAYLNKPLKLLFVAASLDALTRLNRDSVHVPVKNWFYGVVLFCLLIYLLRSLIIKKSVR